MDIEGIATRLDDGLIWSELIPLLDLKGTPEDAGRLRAVLARARAGGLGLSLTGTTSPALGSSPRGAARGAPGPEAAFAVVERHARQYREAGMKRRLAILDDNHERLHQRLVALRRLLPPLIAGRACAAIVIGSVAKAMAEEILATAEPWIT